MEYLNIYPLGIVGDGVTDDSFFFQDTLSNHPTTEFSFPPRTYRITQPLFLRSNITLDLTGSTIIFDNTTDYLFSLEGASSKQVYIKGGEYSLQGSLGAFYFRGLSFGKIEDVVVNQHVMKPNSSGIHIVNSFNIDITNFNVHGWRNGSGSAAYLTNGIKLETDSGEGWTVMNNISIRHGVIQRCNTCIEMDFVSSSKTFLFQDLAFLGHLVNQTIVEYGLKLDGPGKAEGIIVNAVKLEKVPFGIYASADKGRFDITAGSFTTSGSDVSVEILSDKGTIVFTSLNAVSSANLNKPYYVFGEINSDITLVNPVIVSSNGGVPQLLYNGLTGIGLIRHLTPRLAHRSSSFTVKTGDDNTAYTNKKATSIITAILPVTTIEGISVSFRVYSANEFRVSVSGVVVVKSTVIGSVITFESSSIGWITTQKLGDWV